MNKGEFVHRIAKTAGLSKRDARKALDAMTGLITDALASNEKVLLPGFGRFEARARKESQRINPQTQKRITVSRKVAPAFKPGKGLKEIIDSIAKADALMREVEQIPGFHYDALAVKSAASLIREAKEAKKEVGLVQQMRNAHGLHISKSNS